jgi:hypothetical protein
MSTEPQPTERDDKTQGRAYEMWERDGRPDGKHLDHWHQAQQELTDDLSPPSDLNSGIVPGAATTEPKSSAV